jgi:putative membrane protein
MNMSKTKIYKIESNERKSDTLSFIVGIVVYAVVLFLASNLFQNFEIKNFLYALIAALVMSALNYALKPLLIYWTLPLSIITFGISYPIVNMIILEICDVLMGDAFVIHGFISMFFISIFISLLKLMFDRLITNKIGGR